MLLRSFVAVVCNCFCCALCWPRKKKSIRNKRKKNVFKSVAAKPFHQISQPLRRHFNSFILLDFLLLKTFFFSCALLVVTFNENLLAT